MTKPTTVPIDVVPYDLQWNNLFEREAALIRDVLGENCLEIHHIGSTSVPGLPAKPIIDMIPVVKDIRAVDACAESMIALGYQVIGECGIPFRRLFNKDGYPHTANVHIFEAGNPEVERHLRFRDYLRTHDAARDAYGALKLQLAQTYREDRNAYTMAKGDFIQDIDAKAGFTGLRLVQALTDEEWAAAKRYRQQYFFDPISLEDPYTWTFTAKGHYHFVFFKAQTIVGYAHLQFWPGRRAALRIIVIEESARNQGLGSYFLNTLERWLMHQGIKSLHDQSRPTALAFYKRNGYQEMPFNDPDGYEGGVDDIDVGKVLSV